VTPDEIGDQASLILISRISSVRLMPMSKHLLRITENQASLTPSEEMIALGAG
jgi:hypothetical protein